MRRIVAALAAVVMLAPVGVTAPARAAEQECHGRYAMFVDTWGQNYVYQGINLPDVFEQSFKIRIAVTTAYWYCPNRGRPNMVRPVWFEVCYSHLDWPHVADNFSGVYGNPAFYDRNETSNPPRLKVGDNGGIQNCELAHIRVKDRAWLETVQGARWTVVGTVDLFPFDDSFRFKWYGMRHKPFVPQLDVRIGRWHK